MKKAWAFAALLGFLPGLLLSDFKGFATAPATSQAVGDEKKMQELWNDLQKPEPWASRALLDLYDTPEATVRFLKDNLKPLRIDQTDLDELLAALGSDDATVWKPAFEKLSYFDPRLNVSLETLMANVDQPTQRNHLVEVLSDYPPDKLKGRPISFTRAFKSNTFDFHDTGLGSTWYAESRCSKLGAGDASAPKKQWTRATRAVVLLQHIGTPDAIAILKAMATGHPDAQPTIVAKVALESLGAADK